ncbi:MAG: hypothetical protein HQL51_07510 [Magnetococcales bacterium]|nr:hypothetical protein [Magnetococcales bacterium]
MTSVRSAPMRLIRGGGAAAWLLLFLGVLGGAPLWAAEPMALPILRVETGMHTSLIRRIATDSRGELLASVADDKTLRIWSLPSGRLLNVLRPPINEGTEGKLYAVALSPGGTVAAVAGLTGWDWDRRIAIYLFEVKKGTLARRITDLPNVVNHLAFSRDGKLIAAVMAKGKGLAVYRTLDGQLQFSDASYGDQSYWVAFGPHNEIVTTSYDGFVRLYDANFKLRAKRKPLEGGSPFGLAISPDGGRIAVGYKGRNEVTVLKNGTLETLYEPDTSGVTGKLQTVAWSEDGRRLFAAGLFAREEFKMARVWEGAGAPGAAFTDLPLARDTVMQLLTIPGGGMAYASADPVLGMVNDKLLRVFHHARPIASFRGLGKGLRVSRDGSKVEFSYSGSEKSGGKARFSVRTLELDLRNAAPSGEEPLEPPLESSTELILTPGREGSAPQINGKPFQVKDLDAVQAAAIAPDRSGVALGTTFSVRYFDKEGRPMWQISAPGEVWAVNISGDGRFVVAAYGDGTLRWYGRADGREVLSFFPHNDRERWILWTPNGYYAASSGGDNLIGWHRNQGKQAAAEFYPAHGFKENYERPDLIKGIFQ